MPRWALPLGITILMVTLISSPAWAFGRITGSANANSNVSSSWVPTTIDNTPPALSNLTVGSRSGNSGSATITGIRGSAAGDLPGLTITVTTTSGSASAGTPTFTGNNFSINVSLGGRPSTTTVTVTQKDESNNVTTKSVQIVRT